MEIIARKLAKLYYDNRLYDTEQIEKSETYFQYCSRNDLLSEQSAKFYSAFIESYKSMKSERTDMICDLPFVGKIVRKGNPKSISQRTLIITEGSLATKHGSIVWLSPHLSSDIDFNSTEMVGSNFNLGEYRKFFGTHDMGINFENVMITDYQKIWHGGKSVKKDNDEVLRKEISIWQPELILSIGRLVTCEFFGEEVSWRDSKEKPTSFSYKSATVVPLPFPSIQGRYGTNKILFDDRLKNGRTAIGAWQEKCPEYKFETV